jgi:Spy/CpxP family protein refolding chaperone
MRKRITLVVATALTAAAMTMGSAAAAFADAPPWKGNDKQFHNKCTGGDTHKNCKNAH